MNATATAAPLALQVAGDAFPVRTREDWKLAWGSFREIGKGLWADFQCGFTVETWPSWWRDGNRIDVSRYVPTATIRQRLAEYKYRKNASLGASLYLGPEDVPF